MSTEVCPNCGESLVEGAWPFCRDSSGKHGHERPHGGTLLTAYHPSERTVVYRNVHTGQAFAPPRADAPMHPKFEAQGYVREELVTPQERTRFEKETGMVHAASNYDKGSGSLDRQLEPPTPTVPKMDYETKRKLAADIAASKITPSPL